MTHASGIVKTPVGDVKVSWKLNDGKMIVEYEAPEGIEVREGWR
jgi:hypothetical protein